MFQALPVLCDLETGSREEHSVRYFLRRHRPSVIVDHCFLPLSAIDQ